MFVIRNSTAIMPDGTAMESCDILVDNGKITAIGRELDVPAQAGQIDASGKYVTPGIIDVHTHIGVHELGVGREGADFNETSSPITPQVRALDGINPYEEGFQFAIRSGVTTIQSFPGSANVIGGEIVALKTSGHIVDHMVIKSPSGMKAAFGENPKRVYGSKDKAPVTRMGIAALFREQFMKAQDYLKTLEKGEVKQRDLGMENLVKVLRGEIPLRAHAHRADDIVTVIRLAEEFGIEVTIEHCTEGHLIPEFLAEKGVRVSVGPTMSAKSKVETKDKGFHTLIVLANAGVPVSITTDHPVVGIEYLVTTAAHAVGAGLDETLAWQMLTVNAAKHIGVEDRVGSIETGKDADLVIWSGHPFDIRNRVEQTFIDGRLVYSAKEAEAN